MSMTAWGSTGGGESGGVDEDDGNGSGSRAKFKQPKRSLTMVSVTASGVPSAAGGGGAAEKASNVAALPSIA